jgi:hypothetical protein
MTVRTIEDMPSKVKFDDANGPSWDWIRWLQKLVALPEPFKTYTPVITAGSGAFTTVSAAGRYRIIGKLVFIEILVAITTNGTAAVVVNVSLPFPELTGGTQVISGRATVFGKALTGTVYASAPSTLQIVNYDNSYPGANGENLIVQGYYEIN